MSSLTGEYLSLATLLNVDRITIEILPEKKGYIKRHVEYDVHSTRFKSQVSEFSLENECNAMMF